jgi:DNA-binding GntR family transcriptional regulator
MLQAMSFLARQRNTSTAVSEHERIFEAISCHDAPEAANMMYAHIDNVLREKKLILERRAEKFQS